jgi:hypothetical protein
MTDRSSSDPTDPTNQNRLPSRPEDEPDSGSLGAFSAGETRDPIDSDSGPWNRSASGGPAPDHHAPAGSATDAEPSRQVRMVTAGPGSPAQPRVRVRSDRSWTWPLINLIGLLVVVLVNALANVIPFNDQTTGEVITRDPIPFQPAGWVFGIWGLIYILLGVFAIYGLLPAGRRNRRLQRISPLFLITNLANITWLVLWHWEQFAASLVVMAVLLVTLIVIYIGVRIRNPLAQDSLRQTKLQRLIMWTPFSIYLGWICVAALANLMVWLDRSGWDGGPFSYNVWAALFIVAGTLAAALFAFLWHDALIPLVFVWAFIGIAQQQWGESTLVSVVAIVFTVVMAGLAAAAMLLAFDRTSNIGRFGRAPVTPSPAPSTGTDQAAETPDHLP